VIPPTGSDAVAVKPSSGSVSAVSARMASSCGCRGDVAMPASRAGTRWRSRSPCSVRNRRTSVTRRCTAASSASASPSAKDASACGQSATTSDSRPVSDVPQGRRDERAREGAAGPAGCRARVRARRASPRLRPPRSAGTLASSTYQSQNSRPSRRW
jgi:hypothetical protein